VLPSVPLYQDVICFLSARERSKIAFGHTSEIKPHLAISVYFSMKAAQIMNKSDPEHDYRG